ncbi:putative metal-binding motif-containing protein [Myxococcota bacterium]|nr:putative metal-binding motif-containing protein [Myxococcota bacterium]
MAPRTLPTNPALALLLGGLLLATAATGVACGDKDGGTDDTGGGGDGGGGDGGGDGGGGDGGTGGDGGGTKTVDNDEDGSPYGEDCDDTDPEVYPGAEEICNGKDDDCDPTTDEAAWITVGETTYETLQAAIDAAPDGDAVRVCSGTFQEQLVIDRNAIVLSELGAEYTVLDGSASPGSTLTITNGDVTFSGFSITGGTGADHRDEGDTQGGGVYVSNPVQTIISECWIYGNHADRGGGVFVDEGVLAELQYSIVTENTATTGAGLSGVESEIALGSCEVLANEASGQGGGMAGDEVVFRVNSGAVKGNIAVEGGGAAIYGDSTLVVTGGDFGKGEGDDNSPDDVWTPKGTWSEYGSGSTFSCTSEGCE